MVTVVAMANLTSHGRPRTEARPLVGHGHGHGHTHGPPTHLYELLEELGLVDELHLCHPFVELEPPD